MLFSQAKGHKVVSTTTAETLGKVDRLIVDPLTQTVIALQLKKTSGGNILAWDSITAFGEDAVTINTADLIVEASGPIAELADKDHELLGKRILTDTGEELGHVHDVAFDPASGQITEILLKDKSLPGAALIGAGSYAVVMTASFPR